MQHAAPLPSSSCIGAERNIVEMLLTLLDVVVLGHDSIFCSDLKVQVGLAVDKLCVLFGCEILKIVPGRVSTEVEAG